MGTRNKDVAWTMTPDALGNHSFDAAQLSVLMDIRDELKRLNRLLSCSNFTGIPETLRQIRKNTTRRKKRPALRRVA